jgi:alpha-L-arabinofuranosidase
LYADTVGGNAGEAVVVDSPTYDCEAYGMMLALAGLPSLKSVAVRSSSGDRLWVYVVNRDIGNRIRVRIQVSGMAGSLSSVTSECLNGWSYTSVNTKTNPNAVTVKTEILETGEDIYHIFPAHSLTRLTFQY